MLCLPQADVLKYMAQKKIPGFIEKVVETLERKNQGDLTLIEETAQAHVNPSSAQVLMQAGSSKVAKAPETIAFVNPGTVGPPAPAADGMANLLQFMKDQREADRIERLEREKEREKRDNQQNNFLLALVETLKPKMAEDHNNKQGAGGLPEAEPDKKRPKSSFRLLGIEEIKPEAKDWLLNNIGKFVKQTPRGVRDWFLIIELQTALYNHSTFYDLCDGRGVKCSCLEQCIKRVYANIEYCSI